MTFLSLSPTPPIYTYLFSLKFIFIYVYINKFIQILKSYIKMNSYIFLNV